MFNSITKIGNFIHHIKATKSIIIKVNNNIKIPKLGQKVFNEEMNEIGYIANIFGPTHSPLIEIRINKEGLSSKIEKIYLKE